MDAYGNRYTYAELGEISEVHPVPKETALTSKDFELVTPEDEDGAERPTRLRRRRERRRQRVGRAERGQGRAGGAAGPGEPRPVSRPARRGGRAC